MVDSIRLKVVYRARTCLFIFLSTSLLSGCGWFFDSNEEASEESETVQDDAISAAGSEEGAAEAELVEADYGYPETEMETEEEAVFEVTVIDTNDVDDDGDGYTETQGDCDDTEAAINPVAAEVCDDVDNNCNGDTNDDDALVAGQTTYFADADGDGFGDSDTVTEACDQPASFVEIMGDCDDTDPTKPELSVTGPSGTNYLTVQEAVNDATDGNCIAVYPGTYVENIQITNKLITLMSTGGSEFTIIDGNSAGSVFDIDLSSYFGSATGGGIVGFTIQNGLASANGGGIYGKEIYDTFEISDNLIQDNVSGSYGGGIMLSLSTNVSIADNIFYNNSTEYGGGIYLGSSDTIIVSGNEMSANSASSGGGALAVNSSDSISLEENTISENTATALGGAAYFHGSTIALNENMISNNASANGGGFYIYSQSEVELTNNIISGNAATSYGGGIYGYSSYLTLTENFISENSASAAGGGVYCYACSDLDVTGNEFRNNTSVQDGGALASTTKANIENNSFSDNSASGTGGAIRLGYTIDDDIIRNNLFVRNNAGEGSAIYQMAARGVHSLNNIFIGNGNHLDFNNLSVIHFGDGTYTSGTGVYILNNLFTFNNESGGGAVYRANQFDVDVVFANNIVFHSSNCGIHLVNDGSVNIFADYNLFYEVNSDMYCGESTTYYTSIANNLESDPLLALSIDASTDTDGDSIPDDLETNDFENTDFMISDSSPAQDAGTSDFDGNGAPDDIDDDGNIEDWDRNGSYDASTDSTATDMGPHGGIYGESW